MSRTRRKPLKLGLAAGAAHYATLVCGRATAGEFVKHCVFSGVTWANTLKWRRQ
jgi:hypothetical protein